MKGYNGFTAFQRTKAMQWMKKEMASGRIPEPTKCEACGQTEGHIDYHTEDYSEPYSVSRTTAHQLCFMCHMMWHGRLSPRTRAQFEYYRELIRAGNRFLPSYNRNIYSIEYKIKKGEYGDFAFEGRKEFGIYGNAPQVPEGK